MQAILPKSSLWKIRSNHALEHATLHILDSKGIRANVSGFSDEGGFWLVGQLPTEAVFACAREALERLQGGESTLAMHENCGSNLVPSILVGGGLGWLAMRGTGKDLRKKVKRLPLAVLLTLIGCKVAQPAGPLLQEKAVTTAYVHTMFVREVHCYKPHGLVIHRVSTEFRA